LKEHEYAGGKLQDFRYFEGLDPSRQSDLTGDTVDTEVFVEDYGTTRLRDDIVWPSVLNLSTIELDIVLQLRNLFMAEHVLSPKSEDSSAQEARVFVSPNIKEAEHTVLIVHSTPYVGVWSPSLLLSTGAQAGSIVGYCRAALDRGLGVVLVNEIFRVAGQSQEARPTFDHLQIVWRKWVLLSSATRVSFIAFGSGSTSLLPFLNKLYQSQCRARRQRAARKSDNVTTRDAFSISDWPDVDSLHSTQECEREVHLGCMALVGDGTSHSAVLGLLKQTDTLPGQLTSAQSSNSKRQQSPGAPLRFSQTVHGPPQVALKNLFISDLSSSPQSHTIMANDVFLVDEDASVREFCQWLRKRLIHWNCASAHQHMPLNSHVTCAPPNASGHRCSSSAFVCLNSGRLRWHSSRELTGTAPTPTPDHMCKKSAQTAAELEAAVMRFLLVGHAPVYAWLEHLAWQLPIPVVDEGNDTKGLIKWAGRQTHKRVVGGQCFECNGFTASPLNLLSRGNHRQNQNWCSTLHKCKICRRRVCASCSTAHAIRVGSTSNRFSRAAIKSCTQVAFTTDGHRACRSCLNAIRRSFKKSELVQKHPKIPCAWWVFATDDVEGANSVYGWPYGSQTVPDVSKVTTSQQDSNASPPLDTSPQRQLTIIQLNS